MLLFFFLNNLFFTNMDKTPSSKLSVLKIHKHTLPSHWIQNSLSLLTKPALQSLLELPRSTTIDTPNKKLGVTTRLHKIQNLSIPQKDSGRWQSVKKEHENTCESKQSRSLTCWDSSPWDCDCDVGIHSLLKDLPLGQKRARTAYRLSLQRVQHSALKTQTRHKNKNKYNLKIVHILQLHT